MSKAQPLRQIEVLLLQTDDGEVRVGTPVVSGAVQGEVVEHMKDRKIIVFKRKRRKGYRRKQAIDSNTHWCASLRSAPDLHSELSSRKYHGT